jgi:superfamily II RNA helicase
MPDNIQMLMLSATIDKEKQFAEWIEKIKHREVWIASTDKRVVPLNHFLYYITNSRFDKKVLSMNKSNTNTSLSTIKSYNKNITNKFLNFDDKY